MPGGTGQCGVHSRPRFTRPRREFLASAPAFEVDPNSGPGPATIRFLRLCHLTNLKALGAFYDARAGIGLPKTCLPDWPGNAARRGVSLVFSHYCSSDICCLSEVAVVLVFHILQKAVDGSGDVRAPEAVLPPEFFLVASRFLAIASS